MADRYAAFISYAHRYAPWVRALQSNLELCLAAAGRPGEVFLDRTDLGSGRSWVTQLQAGIDRSEHLVLIATPEALASPRVGDEWGSFLSPRRGWLEQGRLHLVSLVDVPMPPFLSQIQRVDFRTAGEAKYRQALRELTAGLLGHSDRRNLPALPADLEIPSPPDPGLDPRLRARLVEWLAPVLASKAYRKAIAPELQRSSAELEGQPSWECAASALLVWATGDEEPLAAAIRIVDTLHETLGEDEPARVADLAPLRKELLRLRQDAPERGLLATWMDQVVKDHERLVPYFQQQAEVGLLDRVYVELEVRSEEGRTALDEGAVGSRAERPGRPLGLLEVLELPREGSISGRWMVLGDPGAGKTTLLRHLAANLARQADRPWVPLLESLPKLMREGGWLLDRVARRLERSGHPAQGLAAVLDRAGKDGRLLLLLDGLDEVPREEKEEVEKLLRDLAIRWPTTPIVVASRPIGFRPPGADYRELRLLPLDRERRREFLARWLGRAAGGPDEARAEAALAALEGPDLRDLAGNPLYLTLMALLFEQGTEPARNRPKLYDQVFDLLLAGKHRPEEQPMEAQEAARALLRHLAVGMTEDNLDAERVEKLEDRLYRPEADAARDRVERVSRWRGRMRQFLDDLSEQTGILGPHDGRDADWRFWHRTFREALAAEQLEAEFRAKDGKTAVLARAVKITTEEDLSAWAEPFALLAGRLEAPDALVKDLVKENRALGLRALATAQRLRPETLREILELSEKWAERAEVYERIPELVGEPHRALALLDQLRKGTTNGNDLFFLDRAVRDVGRRFPDHAKEAADVAARLYNHIAPPEKSMFRLVDTAADGRVDFWRKIPLGYFLMGSTFRREFPSEWPPHHVGIPSPFRIAATPVTVAQYKAFDSMYEPPFSHRTEEGRLRLPATQVTWYAAVSFCRWLRTTCEWAKGLRLPMEEEWEYACRAGSSSRYWCGDEEQELAEIGWYARNSRNRLHRVGEKSPNKWGLYDAHGNAAEWVLDPPRNYFEDGKSSVVNASTSAYQDLETRTGGGYVLRGGCYWDPPERCRAAWRFVRDSGYGLECDSFRIVLPE